MDPEDQLSKYKQEVILLPKDKISLLKELDNATFADIEDFQKKTGDFATYHGKPIVITN